MEEAVTDPGGKPGAQGGGGKAQCWKSSPLWGLGTVLSVFHFTLLSSHFLFLMRINFSMGNQEDFPV